MKGRIRIHSGIVLGVLAVSLLASCGGSGGSGGSGDSAAIAPAPTSDPSVLGTGVAPTAGPGDATSLLPTAAAMRWYYDAAATGPGLPEDVRFAETVAAQVTTQGGIPTFKFSTSYQNGLGQALSSSDETLGVSGGGITLFGRSDAADPLTSLLAPLPILLFPVTAGVVATVSATGLPFTDAQGTHWLTNLTDQHSVLLGSAPEMTAGVMPSGVSLNRALSGTLTASGVAGQAIAGTESEFLVPNVGPTNVMTTLNVGTAAGTRSLSLRGYERAGQLHGFSNPTSFNAGAYSVLSGVGTLESQLKAARPSVASDGTNSLVVARQLTGVGGPLQANWSVTLLGPDRSVISTQELFPNPIPATGNEKAFVVWDGAEYFVVADGIAGGSGFQLFAQRFDAEAKPAYSSPASFNDCYDLYGLGFDGTNVLVVYESGPPIGTLGVSGELVSPAFNIFTTFTISTSPVADGALVFDGSNYLFVGSNISGLSAWKVATNGSVASNSVLVPTAVGTSLGSPALAFDGTQYLLAWSESVGSTSSRVMASRVSASLSLLDSTSSGAGISLDSGDGSDEIAPTAASNTGEFLVAWTRHLASSGLVLDLRAARVSAQGVVVSGAPNGFGLSAPRTANNATDSGFAAPALFGSGGSGSVGLALFAAIPASGADFQLAAVGFGPFGP